MTSLPIRSATPREGRESKPRYAVYFAPPPASPWWRFGAHWLGRDETSGALLPQTPPPHSSPGEFERITAEPRRYGFHATLKAPFRLAAGCDADHLLKRVRAVAAGLRPVPLGTLVPVFVDGFVALGATSRAPALNALAAACTKDLDDLRAPLGEADRLRRRIDPADARASELLERYGYPHVLERFRFHMTLTGPVETTLAARVVSGIAGTVARLNTEAPPVLDRLCLFCEPVPNAPMRRIADVELQP
jgi:putative phosphonate metabolism protein